ncbi:MAG: SGNH/GDSL hydrolase family protein, partial [Candidatus Acidiferrum sp.]
MATLAALPALGIVLVPSLASAQSSAPGPSPAPGQAPGQTESCDCAQLAAAKAQLSSTALRIVELQKAQQDWPNLTRYREANAKLAPPAPGEKRVVFMGDSITDMWADARFGGFFPGKPYIDRGISGQTTPQMLIRFRPDVIALAPKVVVILAGTNDLAGNTGPMTVEETEANLESMAELAKASGIRVVLASVMPVSDYGHNAEGKPLNMTTGRPPAKILEINAWIKNYARQHHDVYLDYFSAMVDDQGLLQPNLSNDGLHPNIAGYKIM